MPEWRKSPASDDPRTQQPVMQFSRCTSTSDTVPPTTDRKYEYLHILGRILSQCTTSKPVANVAQSMPNLNEVLLPIA